MFNKIIFPDKCSIEQLSNDQIRIKNSDEELLFDKNDKPVFKYDTGETVIEYSGLASDKNPVRSWGIASYGPKGYSTTHYHQNETEDYYIISGHATVMIDNKEHHLSVGDHIRILPGQTHQVVNESELEELALIVKCAPAWSIEDYHVSHFHNSMKS